MPQPLKQSLPVGVAGDALNLRHAGTHQARDAVDADFRVAVEDLPAQRALRLIADEEDRAGNSCRQDVDFFPPAQGRGNEGPELVEKDRQGQKDA